MKTCHNCGKELQVNGRISRTEECPFCRAYLYCCRNCSFFDPTRSKQCREPAAELVSVKTKANYCDYFSFAERSSSVKDCESEKARTELDALFKRP
jgi:hypothetical protein